MPQKWEKNLKNSKEGRSMKKRPKWDKLGDPVQILSSITAMAVVFFRGDRVAYLLFGNKMIDDPSKEMCILARERYKRVDIIHLQ